MLIQRLAAHIGIEIGELRAEPRIDLDDLRLSAPGIGKELDVEQAMAIAELQHHPLADSGHLLLRAARQPARQFEAREADPVRQPDGIDDPQQMEPPVLHQPIQRALMPAHQLFGDQPVAADRAMAPIERRRTQRQHFIERPGIGRQFPLRFLLRRAELLQIVDPMPEERHGPLHRLQPEGKGQPQVIGPVVPGRIDDLECLEHSAAAALR